VSHVVVLDAQGNTLSPCPASRAEKLVACGRAEWLSQDPPTIRIHQVVTLPAPVPPARHALFGKRMLLHICCAPCATFTVDYLRELGADLTGYWYNPNIHPYSEHERRRETLAGYASSIALPMVWEPGYEMPAYFRAVAGCEQYGVRCALCYRLRLEQTARVAAARGYQVFGTTLTISPYQDIESIRRVGEALAEAYGVAFYWENLRRGYAESRRLAAARGLYRQRYCGCVYSEWESLDREASTAPVRRVSP
jgi:epoxyqueuosine reductase